MDGVDHPLISVHLCHAHSNRQHSTRGPYDLVIGTLGRMNVRRFAMEFATPGRRRHRGAGAVPQGQAAGSGVIDHTDINVETPGTVVERAEAAMQYVPAERLTLNPDCGFAPSSINPMDLDEAFLKLRALCEGAESLRGETRAVTQQNPNPPEDASSLSAKDRDRAARAEAVARFRRRRASLRRIEMTTEEILVAIHEGRRL